jgi:hypothetical protein
MPVLVLMAIKAERDPIAHIKAQIRKVDKWFDVVRLQTASPLSALLAGITIPFVNRLTPMGEIVSHSCSLPFKALPPLPSMSQHPAMIHRLKLVVALAGAEPRVIISPIRERLAALGARFNPWGIANRPTFFRAIFGRILSVLQNLKRLTANRAGLDDPLPSVLAPDLIVTFHRAALGRAKSRMEGFTTNRAYLRGEFHYV